MAERFDLLSARESNGKTYWTKCGAMFPTKSGEGWSLVLDVIPAPNDGQFRLTAMVPKPRDDAPPARGSQFGGGAGQRRIPPPTDDLDDDVPFATNSPFAREPGASRRMI